ncbi:hypothetical protein RRF57_005861 [Xylaria bambusicola]|uniref:Uncharacterized protein n=1 Tax=Xylaria bambusicola TaxID=326684 RepID=A0AAN7UR66_9PEZI
MRPQLISPALTSGALTSTTAAQQGAIARGDASSLRPAHESSRASGEFFLERHDKRKRKCDEGDDNDDEKEDDDGKCPISNYPTKTFQTSQYHPQPTSMSTSIGISITSTNIVTTGLATSELIAYSTTTTTRNSLPSGSTSNATSTVYFQGQQTDRDESHENYGNNNDVKIALGVVGGLFGLVLLFILYWVIIRPRRWNHLRGQPIEGFSKDADLESHVTVDLRIHTPHSEPHDLASSSDALSGYTIPISASRNVRGPGHIIVDSAAGSVSISTSPGSAHAGVYPATQRTANAPSPATSHTSFREAQGEQRSAHSEAHHPRNYSPVGGLRRSVRLPVCPPLPPPLQICAPPIQSGLDPPPTSDLDGPLPPPRYPETTATSPAPHDLSPISPILVSPLSVISGHEGFVHHLPVPCESQYHAQQQNQEYKGPQRPGCEGYESSTMPEVVSPICQLGQTSASPPEYDYSAETARSSDSNSHHILASRRPSYEGGEKQALQQAMYRY